MIKNKYFLFLVLGAMIFGSVNFTPYIRSYVLDFSNEIKKTILTFTDHVSSQVNSFFDQKKKILMLERQLRQSEKTAQLSVAFASQLNHFLEENKLQTYDPDLYLSRAISYVTLGDFQKMWIDFPNFNKTQIYGLLYKGYAAGIVDTQSGRPMARLLGDANMMFSVAIGKERHLGVVFGNSPNLFVKYIPTYADVHIGDEVITSGNDNIFFEGIKVGKVTQIETTNLYKMATVKPYIEIKNPAFFYVVDVHSN